MSIAYSIIHAAHENQKEKTQVFRPRLVSLLRNGTLIALTVSWEVSHIPMILEKTTIVRLKRTRFEKKLVKAFAVASHFARPAAFQIVH